MDIHHLALRVVDLERSAAFYAGVLGLRSIRRNRDDEGLRSVWLAAGGAVLMLERRLAGAGAAEGSGHLLALSVEDVDAWEPRLRSAGVEIDGRSAHTLYFRDPDGHRVGLSDHRLGGTPVSPELP